MIILRTGHLYLITFGMYAVRGDYLRTVNLDGEWWSYFRVEGLGEIGFEMAKARNAREIE